ncbi:hypothetical protein AUQ37_06175 [Candidatus Methanomethylophilus sp. 1R26]|uniref:zinc ribbon domain-containing protein n=1 Tax=Candidatus Methanomethylophilus sp. 1R26 TaxID=1769296 RepID=UPI0007369C22|nr:zinc ribbon domain-containing protein [Candidatus Methanomethylophilus sp. 1R26]KUE74127.1 hypothetical protein AUQ37_06175 [Candidatus Methanomethylophilus sp. 1R26]WII09206.1 zinc ribbon domain-containing protein [Methanomassiliicoccales archaeon LGM-DZ1]
MTRYCTECGREIADGDKFCPYCGASAEPDATSSGNWSPGAGYQQAPENARWLNDYRRVTAYLLLLWGVIALIDGIYSAVLSESSADTMIDALEDAGLWENGEYMGLDRNDFVNIILVSSMAEIISGALALVSGHFTFRAQKYKLSLWCCLLSTIFACFGIITLICGIYVTYRISNCKESFGS